MIEFQGINYEKGKFYISDSSDCIVMYLGAGKKEFNIEAVAVKGNGYLNPGDWSMNFFAPSFREEVELLFVNKKETSILADLPKNGHTPLDTQRTER